MARVRHPNLQSVNGSYLAGATVTAVTDRTTEEAADAYTTEEGATTVTYPVVSGAEGEVAIWVAPGSYESTFGDDTVDEPAVWEAVVGVDSGAIADAIVALEAAQAAWEGPFIDVKGMHGAVGDGVADDTAAVQAAIDDAKGVGEGSVVDAGGKLFFPPGIYRITDTLNCGISLRRPYHMFGVQRGKVTDETDAATVLWYDPPTPAGAGPLIEFLAATKVELSHMHFRYTGGFDGDLIDVCHNSGTPVQGIHIHHISTYNGVVGGGGRTARSIVRFAQALGCVLEHSQICGSAVNGVRFENAFFNNIINIANCEFNGHDGEAIFLGSPDLESVTIENNFCEINDFIRGARTADGDSNNGNQYALMIRNNWCGDYTGEKHCISGLRSATHAPCVIEGNFFDSMGSTGQYLGLESGPFYVIGNSFTGTGSIYGDSGGDITSIGNTGDAANSVFTTPPTGSFTSINDTGNHTILPSVVNIRRGTTALPVADEGTGNKALVIGNNNSGTPAPSGFGAIYNDTAVANGTIVIQPSTDSNARSVILRCGTSPATKFQANGTGLGFYGTTPIAKPTGVAVDAAGIHAALVSLGLIAA